jgi:hypothetical protein
VAALVCGVSPILGALCAAIGIVAWKLAPPAPSLTASFLRHQMHSRCPIHTSENQSAMAIRRVATLRDNHETRRTLL